MRALVLVTRELLRFPAKNAASHSPRSCRAAQAEGTLSHVAGVERKLLKVVCYALAYSRTLKSIRMRCGQF